MNKMWLAVVACVVMLAGCSMGAKPVFPQHYALSAPAPAASSAPAPAAAASADTLQVARIAVAPWLEGTGLYYRLDYRHDDRIAAYSRSDWVAPPARMLEQMLRNALSQGSAWHAVIGPGSTATAAFTLHVRLNDFSQAFASPSQSQGVLDAVVTLVDNRNEAAVAQKHFHLTVAAPSADAAGGVKALNRASGQFATHVRQWLRANTQSAPSATR